MRKTEGKQGRSRSRPAITSLLCVGCSTVQCQDQATLGYLKQPALAIGGALQRRCPADEIRKPGCKFLDCQQDGLGFVGQREIHQNVQTSWHFSLSLSRHFTPIGLFSVIAYLILFLILSGKHLTVEKLVIKSELDIKKFGLFGFLSNRYILTLSAFIVISSVALRFIDYSFFNVTTVQFKSDSLELLTFLNLFEALKLFSASYSPHL